MDDPLTVVHRACNAADSRDWETNRAASTSGASTGPELGATSLATRQSLPIVLSVTRSVLGSSEIPWSAMMHVRPWRWRTTGRHDRDFLGVARTRNGIDVSGATIAMVQGGRIVELETFPDRYTLLTRLGVLSSLVAAS